MKKIIKGQVKSQVKEQVSCILPRIEESMNATLKAEVLTRSSHSSRTSYAIAADLSEMELKKIFIEKIEGNKESTILKRRREDDDQEGPSAGSDRGFKRQREGGEHASASTPTEIATGSAGRSTTRLPVRWRNPYIRCLKQVPTINQLLKPLSILNGFPSQKDHHHQIVTGTKLCQLLKEMLNHG
nr:hypothetical protein [Tanacetum cinerariifolium]